MARRLGRGVRGRRRQPRQRLRRPERPPARLRLERPAGAPPEGPGSSGDPLRPGGVGARLPDGDRAAVDGDRRDAEGRGCDRPGRSRERQRRHGPRGQAHVVGLGGPGPRRPAASRTGDAAACRLGRAVGGRRPDRARERPARAGRDGAAPPPPVPRHPDRRGRDDPAVVARRPGARLRPRRPPGLGLLAANGEVPERGSVLPPAPGLEARARPARPRGRPDLDGPRLLEPPPRLPGGSRRRREHAPSRRLLAGPRDDRKRGPVAERAVPLQHRRPLRPLRRGHGRGEGLLAAGQGRRLRGRARALSTRSPARRATWRRRSGSRTRWRVTLGRATPIARRGPSASTR